MTDHKPWCPASQSCNCGSKERKQEAEEIVSTSSWIPSKDAPVFITVVSETVPDFSKLPEGVIGIHQTPEQVAELERRMDEDDDD